jgi:hypothetical protein
MANLVTDDPLVHQGENESIVGFAPRGLPNPRCERQTYAKGRGLPIPGEQITMGLLTPRCTR